ncbi:uncharacterized protein VTP21DRAFT_222 [Calcarisporiella thermophila]|uniref:uncharacterized protein n=1 Tax=Calcarisporiella thermophila TaxID=911321 RepID=UPI0037430E00
MTGKVAIIFGSNGISGHALTEHLLTKTSPQDFKRIICVSQRPPLHPFKDADKYGRLEHITIDLYGTPLEKMKEELKKGGAQEVTHLYFFAYRDMPTDKELIDWNLKMLKNAVIAVEDIASKLQRVHLQTGTKYYGCHHPNNTRTPYREEYPRLDEPNFYYDQEDFLLEHQKGKKWAWVVVRPDVIVGSSRGNFMSMAPTIGLYFALVKELGLPALFYGSKFWWEEFCDFSYAPLLAEFTVWASTHEQCANEAFNCVNGDVTRWENIWPLLCKYFDVPCPEQNFNTQGKQSGLPSLIDLVKSHEHEWDGIAEKYGLDKEAFKYATWQFAEGMASRTWKVLSSMSKARKLGWTGYKDSDEMWIEIMDRLKRDRIIPNYKSK